MLESKDLDVYSGYITDAGAANEETKREMENVFRNVGQM